VRKDQRLLTVNQASASRPARRQASARNLTNRTSYGWTPRVSDRLIASSISGIASIGFPSRANTCPSRACSNGT
jgi:hypothetical protein